MTLSEKSLVNQSLNKELMDLLQSRLDKGQETYNSDVMLVDNRDFVKETLEEVLDGLIYSAAQLLRIYKGHHYTP